MIVPFLQMKLTAFLWYQAEANVGYAGFYRCAFPAMITDWRLKWGLGNVPFIFAQLAPYTNGATSALADMRLAQTAALALPKVGMASTIDLGSGGTIHPLNKFPVGYRMGLIAQALVYGATNIIYSGPTLDSATISSAYPNVAVIVNFLPNTIGSGLVLINPAACPISNTSYCHTWEIGLTDGSWHNATASIVNNVAVQITLAPTFTVSNTPKKVAADLAIFGVRYLYSDYPVAPLYSISTGLPASPFYFVFVQ